MIKSHDAVATCFDFDGGKDGPYAMFHIGDKNMRVVVHMTADELRAVLNMRKCKLTIQIEAIEQDATT
jgi:diphthamide synthase (EF-2-diphthine--ammonia ligase)